MSALGLLKTASTGDLFTGTDGNPWNRTWATPEGEAANEITVALWDCGLLRLPPDRELDGCRRWELTELGRAALATCWDAGPPGFVPPVGGPYDAPAALDGAP